MQANNQPVTAKKKRLSFGKIFLIIFLILAVGAAGAAWYGWTWLQSMLEPVSAQEEQILVTIPKGATSARVGKILEDAGLIHNSTVFRLWLRHYELDGKIQAGDYFLSPSQSLSEIVDKLVAGEVYRETLRFTIPEGLFLTDIAARLAEKGIVDEGRFLELASDLSLWQDYWFIQELPEGSEVPLEGYLFPETYEIFASEENREELIIDMMLRQFEKVFTQEMRDQAKAMGMSVHEVVTLASIVEKEAIVDHERPIIAGVFLNRLEKPMALQSCATVNYVLQDFSIRNLSKEQMAIPSPYNTYINRGLPPGPIAAPGQASLKAVLWPERTDYLYFVAKDDGSSEHYFGRNFEEHQANIKKAQANRK
ncbi:MAG: endolytic transglycosylase MltG [Bacillota bacterium]|jgi:UPF0755 protein